MEKQVRAVTPIFKHKEYMHKAFILTMQKKPKFMIIIHASLQSAMTGLKNETAMTKDKEFQHK